PQGRRWLYCWDPSALMQFAGPGQCSHLRLSNQRSKPTVLQNPRVQSRMTYSTVISVEQVLYTRTGQGRHHAVAVCFFNDAAATEKIHKLVPGVGFTTLLLGPVA